MRHGQLCDTRWRHTPFQVSILLVGLERNSDGKQMLTAVKKIAQKQDTHNK